ncbi:hypothetical protein DER46DRAFT_61275 [Fusarium sp. MPI-SDFR-AT-0072]|nr:hypothetical protein DER46DRAFT_61275 [Fusarium sp. MPI-SDFR-AT-0072]
MIKRYPEMSPSISTLAVLVFLCTLPSMLATLVILNIGLSSVLHPRCLGRLQLPSHSRSRSSPISAHLLHGSLEVEGGWKQTISWPSSSLASLQLVHSPGQRS